MCAGVDGRRGAEAVTVQTPTMAPRQGSEWRMKVPPVEQEFYLVGRLHVPWSKGAGIRTGIWYVRAAGPQGDLTSKPNLRKAEMSLKPRPPSYTGYKTKGRRVCYKMAELSAGAERGPSRFGAHSESRPRLGA